MIIPVEKVKIHKHVISHAASELRDIMRPLNDNLGIRLFSYQKLYRDKSATFVTSDPYVTELFIQLKCYEHMFFGDINCYKNGYYIADSFEGEIPRFFLTTVRNVFGLEHHLILLRKYPEYCEFFFFATYQNNHMIYNIYLNNMDIFEQFAAYFKEKAVSIISQADRQRIFYGTNASDTTILAIKDLHKGRDIIFPNIYLTNRERECAQYLKEGLTCKEISRCMSISYRTVEKHVEKLKEKLSCANKSRLIVQLNSDVLNR